jgi:uncharacterized membrane protein YjjB (DUF3815 family)
MTIFWLVAQDAFWSGVAALGFAVLFNVPVRTLPACALGGAVGHATRTLLMQFGLQIETAALAGATVIGFLSIFFARRWRAPAPVFAVTGAIPMVPGTFAFRTMMGLLTLTSTGIDANASLLVEISLNAVKTALILGALAAGIAAPALFFRRRRPIG